MYKTYVCNTILWADGNLENDTMFRQKELQINHRFESI